MATSLKDTYFKVGSYGASYNPRFVSFYPLFEVHLCAVTFGLVYG